MARELTSLSTIGRVRVQAVFFDVGYTLFNETRQWREWAQWLGVSDEKVFAALRVAIERGQHHRTALAAIRPGIDVEAEQAARLTAGKPDRFSAGDVYPDARACLNALHAADLLVGVAGNTSVAIERAIHEARLPVDVIGSSEGWAVQKPQPEFFQRMANSVNLSPDAIAYVGDRLDNDVKPAVTAGFFAVFLRRGPWAEVQARRLTLDSASAAIDSLSELPALLGIGS